MSSDDVRSDICYHGGNVDLLTGKSSWEIEVLQNDSVCKERDPEILTKFAQRKG